MKNVTRILAVLLAVFMMLSVAACHPKDETALTVDGNEITSALYMYALVEADSEARTQIDAAAEEETSSDTTTATTTIDYFAEEIDGKSFTEWVNARALEICYDIALYENLCEENGLELSEEDEANVEYMVSYYWDYYGYSALYEPNGIGRATFTRAMQSDYLKDAYFKSLYGEEGKTPVAKADKEAKVTETFLLAEMISESISDLTEDEQTAMLDTFNSYKARLEKGETFEAIYNEHYEIEEDTTTSSTDASSDDTSSTASTDETSSDGASSEEEEKPDYKYPLGTVMSAADSEISYASDYYLTVSALKNDEVLVEKSDTEITLIIRRDLMSDARLVEELSETALWLIKEEEFETNMDELVKEQNVKKNDYAIDRFKVKKIVYPSYE